LQNCDGLLQIVIGGSALLRMRAALLECRSESFSPWTGRAAKPQPAEKFNKNK